MAAIIPPLPMRGTDLRATLQSLRDAVVFKFNDMTEMAANPALNIGDRGALPSTTFEVVAANTCPPNGVTAVDLPGSGLMALLLPSEGLPNAAAVAADTRPVAWFGGITHLRTLEEGFVYRLLEANETAHMQTAGGLDLQLVPLQGKIHAAALPETSDPVVRINTASRIAGDLNMSCDATGMGTLDCTTPLRLVRSTEHFFRDTILRWNTDINTPVVTIDLDSADGGSACRIHDLRVMGPGKTSNTDGIFLVGEHGRPCAGFIFERCYAMHFRHARIYGSNAYINTFRGGIFHDNHSALYAPPGLTNLGEKTLDLDCTISGCNWAAIIHTSMYYEGERCSYDYNIEGDFDLDNSTSGWVRLHGGNWEWDAAAMTGPRVLTYANTTYGPQGSYYVSATATKITVRNQGTWPAQTPFAQGAADILWDACHTYGIGSTTEYLAKGGGRVHSENCSFSINPKMCFFGGEGRGLNRDGGFGDTNADLFARRIFLRGPNQTASDASEALSIALEANAARTGSRGLRATVSGGTGFKQIYAYIPSKHGGLPSLRFWTRAGTATGSMEVSIYHGHALRWDTVGARQIPIFDIASSPRYFTTTVDHDTDWQQVTLTPTTGPESHAFRQYNEWFFVLIDLANTTDSTGNVDFDELTLDMFGGRKR